MIRVLSFAAAIVFLASLSQLKAAEQATQESADTKRLRPTLGNMPVQDDTEVWRSARIVNDLAAFDISRLSQQKTGAWIVARIHPGGLSGAAHLQGGYLQAETGKVIDNGVRPKLVILVGGQWELIELLSGEAPREGRYQWKDPAPNYFDRNFSLLDLFSVFTCPKNDGTVICRFFEKRTGAEQFSSVTLIPDDWKTFVKPAHEYYVQHAADFAGKDLDKLRKLALSENPLVGVTAIRHLLDEIALQKVQDQAKEDENIDMLVDLARSLPKFRQATFVSRLLNRNDDDSRNLVLKAISRANNTSELAGMALGIYSWSVSQAQQVVPEATQILHGKLMEKWRSLDPSIAEDDSWNKILLAPDIPKDKSTQTNEYKEE